MGDYSYVIEYADKYQKASDKVTVEEIDDLESRVDLQTKYNLKSTGNLIVVKNGEKYFQIDREGNRAEVRYYIRRR